LNLPYTDEFEHCPKCEVPTATKPKGTGIEVLTLAEIRELQFLWYLESETTDEREKRRVADEVQQRIREERVARFSAVLDEAGFNEWERERHDMLEARFRLPAEQRRLTID
jgi:hypothetical protein